MCLTSLENKKISLDCQINTHRSVFCAAFDSCTWLRGVLSVVKHEHIWGGGLGGDDAGILGHVAGPVYLPLMADLDFNLDLAAYGAKASELCWEIQDQLFTR